MHIANAFFAIALLGVMFYSYTGLAERRETNQRHARSSHVILQMQQAVYQWHADVRHDEDIEGWDWPIEADRDALLDYMPTDILTGNPPRSATDGQTLIIAPIWHGGGDQVALTWTRPLGNDSIQLRLLGGWTDEHRNHIQSVAPTAVREDTDAEAAGTLALSGASAAIRIDLPHPANQAVLSNAMRRASVQTGGRVQGLLSPLPFERTAIVTINDGCGFTSAISTDIAGVPMACVDHDSSPATERIWRALASTHVYCRDLRVPHGDPKFTQNAPNHVPVVATDWLDGSMNPGTAGYDVRVPAVLVGTDWKCPDPFMLEAPIPGIEARFCEHTFN